MTVKATVHVTNPEALNGLAPKFVLNFAARPNQADLFRMRIMVNGRQQGYNFYVVNVWHESDGDENVALIVTLRITDYFNPAVQPSNI